MAQIVWPIDSDSARVWDSWWHHLLHYRWRQLSAVLMTLTCDGGILIWWSPPRYRKSSHCHVFSSDIVMRVMTDARSACLDCIGQLNKLNTFIDPRSSFAQLRQISTELSSVLWRTFCLECRNTISTKEYLVFSQLQPKD